MSCMHSLPHTPLAMHGPRATHVPWPRTPPSHACPLPCMPPAMHAPHAHPPAMHAPAIHAPRHACPPCGQTHSCKHITLPQTSFAGGKYKSLPGNSYYIVLEPEISKLFNIVLLKNECNLFLTKCLQQKQVRIIVRFKLLSSRTSFQLEDEFLDTSLCK